MQHKVKGNVVKLRITQEDVDKFAQAIVIPALAEFTKGHPERIVPVQAYKLELRGDIVITLIFGEKPEELVEKLVDA